MLRPLLSANAGFIGETIMLRSSWHRVVIDSESTLAGVQVMAIARTSSASAARRTSRPTTTGGAIKAVTQHYKRMASYVF